MVHEMLFEMFVVDVKHDDNVNEFVIYRNEYEIIDVDEKDKNVQLIDDYEYDE